MTPRKLLLILAFVTATLTGWAQTTLRDSVFINFRQSKIYLDTAYMDNRSQLDGISRRMQLYTHPDSAYVLTGVTVVGGASPEGSVRFNEWLSHRRAERIFDHLSQSITLPDSLTQFTFLGRDWGGLLDMVKADPQTPYRDEVIALLQQIILNSRGGEKESARNLLHLKQLRGGVPYLYMYRHHFPHLRASKLVMDYVRPEPAPEEPAPDCIPDTVVVHDTVYIERIVYQTPECRPFYMGVKSNLIYDALAVPNIGVEFYLGKNISLAANWWYAWWKTDRRHRYWRTYGGDMELRYWFGSEARRKPLTGHHIGLTAGILTYDFEWGGRGYMGGLPGGTLWDKANYMAGVEYGYSLPIARRLNLDFALALGYLGGQYREYIPQGDCYVWQSTKQRNYFGPIKAEVSLVWLIGCDNYNRKGGRKGK